MRKRISQREAVRNRKELRRLRAWVDGLLSSYAGGEVATIEVSDRVRGVYRGLAIAGGFVVRANIDGEYVRLRAIPLPAKVGAT